MRHEMRYWLFAGTYTATDSKGIYLLEFDAQSGALEYVGLAAEIPNPTFLALRPQGGFLYSVSEIRDDAGRHDGAVNAFALDARTGRLTFLNHQFSRGVGPCHVSVDHTGRFALAANYGSGSVAMFPIQDDGRLAEASDSVQHEGSSLRPDRQAGPHAHSITPSPDNRFALAADLGLDRVIVYRLDLAAGRLRSNDPPWGAVKPGAGARHIAFHPRLPFVYVINELDNTMTAFEWNSATGALRAAQTLSTLPAGHSGKSCCADVHVSPCGRFLYGSNRGGDSIAIYHIDASTGALSPVDYAPTLGAWPRNFALDPSGAWLLAANEKSDSVVVFRVDPATGRLSPAGPVVRVPMPVCLKLVPIL